MKTKYVVNLVVHTEKQIETKLTFSCEKVGKRIVQNLLAHLKSKNIKVSINPF